MNAPKMVEADHVKQPKHPSHSLFPPAPTLLAVGVPIVQNRAPFLAPFAEIIRWDARHHVRHALGVELKQVSMSPYVCRIVRDEHRYIADERNAQLIGCIGQPPPRMLHQPLFVNVVLCTVPVDFHRLGVPVSKRLRPPIPRPMFVRLFDGGIEPPILEPVVVFVHWLSGITSHQFGPCRKGRRRGVGRAVLVGGRNGEHLPSGVVVVVKPPQKTKGVVEGRVWKGGEVAEDTFPFHAPDQAIKPFNLS